MYRLMIIEDEPIIRAGLRKLITWSDFNFEICAEGVDGKDGLKKIFEYSPDLVLVDIKMPGMNGLDLIREARKRKFDGKFIILTGYADFEYAKSAISLGVRAYLLKPIDEDELRESVMQVLAELETKRILDDYHSVSESKARQDVLRCLLQPQADKKRLEKEIKLFGLDFKFDTFCVVIISRKNETEGLEMPINAETCMLVQKGLGNVDSVTVDNNLVLICKGVSYLKVKVLLAKGNERLKRDYNGNHFISIGHDVSRWEDIIFSYECAKLLTNNKFLFKDTDIVCIDDLKISHENSDENFASHICDLIEIGDTDSIRKTFRDLGDLYKSRVETETDIKLQVIHNMILLYSMLEKKYSDKLYDLPDFNKVIECAKNSLSLNELIGVITDYSVKVAGKIGITSTDNIVKRVLSYMERNYVNDLKLEDLAKLFSYNSAYLGKVFKKATGSSFNEVLNSIRIENAKRLLLETDLKVYQISEQVGYSNTDYFYSKFRRYVGVSPKEFIERNKSQAE